MTYLLAWRCSISFLVTEIEVRTQERSTSQRSPVNIIAAAEKLESNIPFDDRIDFAKVQGFGGKPPERLGRALPFNAGRADNGKMALQDCGVWPVRNARFDFMGMRTEGLPDLDSAWRRQAPLENELQATCPHHRSALLLPTASAIKQLVGVC